MKTVFSAAGVAILVLLTGSMPWAVLGSWNQRVGLLLPWAVAPMAVYLVAYFQFINGRWTPDRAACWRTNLRANRLTGRMWGVALPAGLLGFGAIMALLAVSARLVPFPAGETISAPLGMPAPTMFTLLMMQSVVAGVTEESAFRGYMQSMIGRRYGIGIAILAHGTLFGLLHFPNHPRDVVVMLPYYIAVSAMYGGLTWATNSIWPALVLHSAGDMVVLTRWWLTGRPEWQMTTSVPPTVWESGFDVSFAITAAVAVALSLLTTWSYVSVRQYASGVQPVGES